MLDKATQSHYENKINRSSVSAISLVQSIIKIAKCHPFDERVLNAIHTQALKIAHIDWESITNPVIAFRLLCTLAKLNFIRLLPNDFFHTTKRLLSRMPSEISTNEVLLEDLKAAKQSLYLAFKNNIGSSLIWQHVLSLKYETLISLRHAIHAAVIAHKFSYPELSDLAETIRINLRSCQHSYRGKQKNAELMLELFKSHFSATTPPIDVHRLPFTIRNSNNMDRFKFYKTWNSGKENINRLQLSQTTDNLAELFQVQINKPVLPDIGHTASIKPIL